MKIILEEVRNFIQNDKSKTQKDARIILDTITIQLSIYCMYNFYALSNIFDNYTLKIELYAVFHNTFILNTFKIVKLTKKLFSNNY